MISKIPIDLAIDRKDFILLFLIIWIQLLGSIANIATFIILIVYSMTSTRSAIKSLMIGFIVSFLNPAIFPKSQYISVLKWILILTSAFRIYLDWAKTIIFSYNDEIPKWIFPLVLFVIFTFISSLFESYNISISLMKLFSFFISVTSILLGFNMTKKYEWYNWFYTTFIAILVSSVPLIFIKKYGYSLNGRGFQGILNHPQSYGVVIIIPLIFATFNLTKLKKNNLISYLLIIIGWFTIYLSQCRTAVFAGLLALFTYSIFNFRLISTKIKNAFGKPTIIILSFVILIIIMLNCKSIYSEIRSFIIKGNYVNNSSISPITLYDKSRVSIVRASISNFKNSPLFGNGFGLASEEYKYSPRTANLFGINVYIGASTEKSFLISALLEEVGIIGSVLFFTFLVFISIVIFKKNNMALDIMYLTAIFTTFGEMTIFSSAGIGLYIWLFIGMGMNYFQSEVK